MGGANHPALGELVRGELYFERMRELADEHGAGRMSGGILTFTVPQGELSAAIGQRKKNLMRLCEIYKPLKIKICEANIQNLALSISEH
jgi:hypothetical protein